MIAWTLPPEYEARVLAEARVLCDRWRLDQAEHAGARALGEGLAAIGRVATGGR